MTVRVAAIGVSHWHSLYDAAYLHHLAAMPDVEIVGIQDDDQEIASHRVSELQVDIPAFTNYLQMLSEVRPDFVLALGRHDTMAGIAHQLLDLSIPFVMEKPMSFNAAELRGVVEKADSTNGFAAVPLGMRTEPVFRYAKKFIDTDTYGPMTHFYARMNRPTSDRYPAWSSPWMLDPKISNGGCLRNLAPHGLDTFVYLTGEGEDIEVTGAQLSWSTHEKLVEDYASVLLKTPKGVLGTIEVGNGFPREGTDAQLKVAFRDAMLIDNDGESVLETADGQQSLPPPDDQPASVLRRIIDAAVNGNSPPVSVRDCYNAVRLIDLAYIAAGNPYGTAAV